MSKKLTPMQEHIAWLEQLRISAAKDTGNVDRVPFLFALGMVKAHAKEQAKKEREEMIDFCQWLSERDFTCDMTSPEDWVNQYFNETFKTEE